MMESEQIVKSYQLLHGKFTRKEITIEQFVKDVARLADQLEKDFDGEVIGGKRFPFVRVTMSGGARILNKLNPGIIKTIGIAIMTIWAPGAEKKRWWKKIRSIAFKKIGLWKWFWWTGYVPKELRCSVILQEKAEEIEESFFGYARVIVNGQGRFLFSVKNSQTQNSSPK